MVGLRARAFARPLQEGWWTLCRLPSRRYLLNVREAMSAPALTRNVPFTGHERSTEGRQVREFFLDDESCGALDVAQYGAGRQMRA